MKVALFSDVHGHLRVVLQIIRNWQRAHEAFLDGALIAGDLGCFPDPSRLDKATLRWIERDPEEAGFSAYFVEPKPTVRAYFEEAEILGPFARVKCPILFIAGNHEDHAFLHSAARQGRAPGGPENTFPVDCYRAFHCIRDGHVTTLRDADGKSLRVGGLWGIELTKPGTPYGISPKAVKALVGAGRERFDLFLTHDAALGGLPRGRGAAAVSEVLRACNPSFHLFGHVYPEQGQHEYRLPEVRTRSFILHDVAFGKKCDGTLAGTLAVLEWNGKEGEVSVAADEWLARMRHGSWHRIDPLRSL